jgi:integrase
MTAQREIFEKVGKYLYKRQYQTADGQTRVMFYAIFTDWKRKRRKFPLGSNLEDAEDALGELKIRNKGRYDFDAERKEREKARVKAITLSEWLDRYLGLVKGMASGEIKRSQCSHLKRLLGHLPLTEVTRIRIMEYKNRRLSEPLTRHGKPVKGTKIKGATVNREVSCLMAALNVAADQELCEGAPKIRKERETARERTLTEAEFEAIVEASPRWLQRVVIAANETGIDQAVLLALTWDCVKDGLIIIKGGRAKTGAKQRVGISSKLSAVLDELRAEYRRVPNTERRVFTKDGKVIIKPTVRHAFDRALKDAKLEDFQFRDFRHCARTRWAAAGLPYEVGEIGIGHKLGGIAGRYINLSDDDIREAFQEMFLRLQAKSQIAQNQA